jgi:hypothetical protein
MGRPPGRPRQVARETIEPLDPEEDFSDVSGDPNREFKLENQDPTKKYAWGLDTREGRLEMQAHHVKWRPVKYVGDALNDPESGYYAVRPVGAEGIYAEGEEITKRGHLLFECSRALWEKRHRYVEGEHLKNLLRNKRRGLPGEQYVEEASRSLPAGVRAGLRAGAEVPAFAQGEG